MRGSGNGARLAAAVTPPPWDLRKDEAMTRSIARRRTIALAAVIGALAPAGVALAEPDTNIQKQGHRGLAFDDPDTSIQKPGHIAISRPLGDA
jgi:hypothetical protein